MFKFSYRDRAAKSKISKYDIRTRCDSSNRVRYQRVELY